MERWEEGSEEECVQRESDKAIGSTHLGKPTGFRKSPASALWSDTVIGDEVLTPARAHTNTRTHAASVCVNAREGEREGRGGGRGGEEGERPWRKTHLPHTLVDARSPLLAWISRTLCFGLYLVGLLLSPMPDQGSSGGGETSRSRVYSDNFSRETMRLNRSASSCRGNSAWEMVTWLPTTNQGLTCFSRLTFLLKNLWRLHVPDINS